MSRAYLLGALHDATEREYTYRLSQKGSEYVETVASLVRDLGFEAWTYREGRTRDVYVVEFGKQVVEEVKVVSKDEKRAYARGYFDADGSVPKDSDARLYVYFAQKDRADLRELKQYLELEVLRLDEFPPPVRRGGRLLASAKTSVVAGEGTVHAPARVGEHVNKVAVGESAAGSPPTDRDQVVDLAHLIQSSAAPTPTGHL